MLNLVFSEPPDTPNSWFRTLPFLTINRCQSVARPWVIDSNSTASNNFESACGSASSYRGRPVAVLITALLDSRLNSANCSPFIKSAYCNMREAPKYVL